MELSSLQKHQSLLTQTFQWMKMLFFQEDEPSRATARAGVELWTSQEKPWTCCCTSCHPELNLVSTQTFKCHRIKVRGYFMPKWNLFLKCRTKTASCENVDSEVTPPEVWDAQAPASHLSARGWEVERGNHGALWRENKYYGRPLKCSPPQLSALGPREQLQVPVMGEGQDGSGQCWTCGGPGHEGLCHCPSSGQAGRDRETQIPA